MTTGNSDDMIKKDISSHFFIPLQLSKKLQDEEIVNSFVKDTRTNSIILEFNHKYDQTKVIVSINAKKWEKLLESIEKRLKDKGIGISDYHIRLIKNVLDDNHEIIIGITDISDASDQAKNDHDNINTKIIIKHPDDEKEEESKQTIIDDNILEIISPSQALRKDIGKRCKVKGTVISISKPFKMVFGIEFHCDYCKKLNRIIISPLPVFEIPRYYIPTTICNNCKRVYGKHLFKPIYVNAINIEIQNSELFDDLERLPVFLFHKNTECVHIGEVGVITGVINILNIKKRHFVYFYAESIEYLNREEFTLTESDIEMIKEFNETHKNNVINEFVEMFDPSIVEHDDAKKGILMSAVNTSEKIGEESEHLDILFIGPPGLGKTKILRRATELVPGSSNAGGQYSSGKTLTAIIDNTDNNKSLVIGLIPRSRGAFCAINELGRLNEEDQDKLYDIMQERWFPFSKYGINAKIPAPTTILASANPVNKEKWINNDSVIDFNQFPFLDPLKDRFDMIFIFQYKETQEERDTFADKLSEIEAKKERKELPDYTSFIIKYIQYAKQINPVLTDEARNMLTEFYKKISAKGFGSPRVLITLPKLAKAVARLKLKNVADEEDAKEAMEFYNAILVKFQKSVIVSQPPQDVAYEKGVSIVERFKNFGVTLEELFEIICQENKQVASYFGYGERSLKIKDNHKTRDVYYMLVKHSNIKIIKEKPIVLKWLSEPEIETETKNPDTSDVCDVCDKDKISKNNKNEEKNNIKSENQQIDPRSHTSHTSYREELRNKEEKEDEEKTQFRLKLSEKSTSSYELTKEQYDLLIGNNDEKR